MRPLGFPNFDCHSNSAGNASSNGLCRTLSFFGIKEFCRPCSCRRLQNFRSGFEIFSCSHRSSLAIIKSTTTQKVTRNYNGLESGFDPCIVLSSGRRQMPEEQEIVVFVWCSGLIDPADGVLTLRPLTVQCTYLGFERSSRGSSSSGLTPNGL